MPIICVFGDSITWGSDDLETLGWVGRLRRFLRKENTQWWEVYNLGISGETSKELVRRVGSEMDARNPDVVLIANGINDSSYRGDFEAVVELEEFNRNMDEIIREAKQRTDKVVVIGLTDVVDEKVQPYPDSDTKKCYANKRVRQFDQVLQQVSHDSDVDFVSMDGVVDHEQLEDGLHPNSEGHEQMYKVIKDYLKQKQFI